MTEPRILLVEDDPSIRMMLQKVLNKEGFHMVDSAETQRRALELCQTYTYDFILLDVMLPDGDGFSICRQIRHLTSATIFFLLVQKTPTLINYQDLQSEVMITLQNRLTR